jgi:hypothetical protein
MCFRPIYRASTWQRNLCKGGLENVKILLNCNWSCPISEYFISTVIFLLFHACVVIFNQLLLNLREARMHQI